LVLALVVSGPLAWTAIGHAQDDGGNRQRGPGRGGAGGDRGGPGRGGQGGFGGFGGGGAAFFGGGGRSGLLDLANRDEQAQAEVKLTDDQKAKIKELADSLQPDRQAMFARFGAAQTDEDRQKLQEEMTREAEERRKTGDAKLKELVSAEQFTRLEQLWLRQAGHGALSRDEIAAALKLSDEQKADVKKIQDEYTEALRTGGFRMPRDEREQLRTDRDAKLAKVLSADQTKVWEVKLGPPPAEAAEAGASTTAATTTSTPGERIAISATTTAPATAATTGKVVATLSSSDAADAANKSDSSETKSGDDTPRKPSGEKMSFNFRFAPWDMVLKMFAEEAGLTLDMAAPPPGTFNYFDKGKYSITEALDILNGYLLQKGFVLVRRDQFLVVLNIDNPIPPNLIPQVSPEELASRGKNELLSVIFPLNGQDLTTVAEEVKAMLGPQGKVVTLAKANRLMVMDIGANLRRINTLLNGPDGESANVAAGFKAFLLKHISATEAEKTIRDLFGLAPRSRTAAATASSASRTSFGSYSPSYRSDGDRRYDERDRDRRYEDFRRDDRSGGSGGGGPPQPFTPPTAVATTKERVTLAVDLRTNSLLVQASAADIAIVEQAIKTIDVPDASGRSSVTGSNAQPQLEVYALVSADPASVVNTLNSLIPGLTINEDYKSRKLHVFATPADHRQVKAIITQLDGGAVETVSVIPLKRMDPVQAVGSLRNLFTGRREDMPSIEADVAGRRLMVRGTSEQLAQIRTLLQQLGEDGVGGAYNGVGEGPIRTLSAGSRDPKELISLVERIWSASSDRNPIRVVVPSAISPASRNIPERRVPSTSESESGGEEDQGQELQDEVSPTESGLTDGAIVIDEPKPASNRPQDSRKNTDADADEIIRELLQLLDDSEEQQPAAKSEPKSSKKAPPAKPTDEAEESPARRTAEKPKAPIAISTVGNSLIISSDDTEALDRLERLIQSLTQNSSGSRTRWTVFYLRSADATETATMLGHLFPQGSITKTSTDSSFMGSLSSGMSSLGGSLMQMTGLNSLGSDTSLRIIPEPRSNALFVSGSEDQIRQIEDVLKILDASELPESLRDRMPRMIPVEHADVSAVAEIVRDVFREELEGQQSQTSSRGGSSRGGGDFNPIAMMMGGALGAAGGRGRKIEMTLGVDTQTNTLVVAASDPIYQRVQTLVKSLDSSALEAKQTVRVMPLDNANSAVVSQALSSIIGRVKVSSTGGSSGRSDSSGRSSSSSSSFPPPMAFPMSPFGSSGSPGSSDAMRQFWEQRMRERMSGSGGSSGPSSFGDFRRSSDGGRGSDGGRSDRDRRDR
jgi:type II secretory pathway component GspD/PulD (secretin)